jgi:hypothetical protein
MTSQNRRGGSLPSCQVKRDIPLVLLVTSVAEKARVPRFEPQFFRDFLT